MMFNLIPQSRVRKAGLENFTDDEINDLTHGMTRVVHKAPGKTSFVCVQTAEGLVEAVLTVFSAHMAKCNDMKIRYHRLCHISHVTILDSIHCEKGLRNISMENRRICACCKMAKSTRKPWKPIRETSSRFPLNTGFTAILSVQLNVCPMAVQNTFSRYWMSKVHIQWYDSWTINALLGRVSLIWSKFWKMLLIGNLNEFLWFSDET